MAWLDEEPHQHVKQQQEPSTPTLLSSLAAWLHRRRAALRRLRLRAAAVSLPGVLGGLAGSGALRELELARTWHAPFGEGHTPALQHSGGLTSLTRLSAVRCGVRRLPPQLSLLGGLRELELGGNRLWGDPGSALAPLQHFASLTRLDLSGCELRRLPPQLSALTSLQDLGLNNNFGLCETGTWRPLQHATALSRLDLGFCGLRALPAELSALRALRELDLQGNEVLGCGGEGAWAPLGAATALTCLRLSRCGLERIPAPLSALAALADLEAGDNHYLGRQRGVDTAFGPLQHATALTRLCLAKCGLDTVPPQISGLVSLVELDLTPDPGIGAFGTRGARRRGLREQLRHLTALTRLRIGPG